MNECGHKEQKIKPGYCTNDDRQTYWRYQPVLLWCVLMGSVDDTRLLFNYYPLNIIPNQQWHFNQSTITQQNMADLQLQANTHLNELSIHIQYPNNPEATYNFQLTIMVHEQIVASQTSVLVYKKTFHFQQTDITIKDLKFSAMYKIEVHNKYGRPSNAVQKTKNIFVYTQAQPTEENLDEQPYFQPQFAQSQIRPSQYEGQTRAVSSITKKSYSKPKPWNKNNQLCNSELLIKTLAQSSHIVNKDKAHKFLLESRKCRNTAEFINEKHGKRINPSQVSDKRMLVIQSKLLFGEIYKYREGCRYFQNNWCMGPFYSYDANQKDIRKS